MIEIHTGFSQCFELDGGKIKSARWCVIVGLLAMQAASSEDVCGIGRCLEFISTIDCEDRNLDELPSFGNVQDVCRRLNVQDKPLRKFNYQRKSSLFSEEPD